MRKRLVYVLLFLLLIATVASANQTELMWVKYTSKKIGVSIVVPSNWDIIEQVPFVFDESLTELTVVIVADVDEGEKYVPNMNIVIEDLDGVEVSALEVAVSVNLLYLLYGSSYGIKDYKNLGIRELTIGEFDASQLTYEITIPNGDQFLRGRQVYIPVGSKYYCLTFTTTTYQWDEYEPIFSEIVNSFVLE